MSERPENPYPGLRPFRRDETHLFFGRDEQTDHLLDRLAETRFIAVTGLSGSGKSSLVQAGLLPNLEFGYLTDAGANWGILTMRPGISPIQNLAQAMFDANLIRISTALDERSSGEVEMGVQALTQRLASGGHLEFGRILQESLSPGQRRSFLLVVDQFEELFRYEKLSRLEERKFFVELLLTSAKQQDVPVYVIMTIRSDSLGECALFRGLPEAINAGQFLVPRLTQEQMRLAITAPAQVVGGAIDDRLVLRLLQDIEYNQDQLPILQHCLMRMWSEAQKRSVGSHIILTTQDYETVGGLQNALSNHADEAYQDLHPGRQQKIAEILFRRLTEEDRRRPSRVQEIFEVVMATIARASISDGEAVTIPEIEAVAAAFRQEDRCFLSPYGNKPLEPDTVLDISHESLIRNWKQLKTWVEQEAESADTYYRLEQTALLWNQGKANLWDSLDLEIALDWQSREHPSPEWAERYGSDFQLAQEFLEASKQAQQEKRQKEEREHQREIETARQLAQAAESRQKAEEQARYAAEERQKAEAQARQEAERRATEQTQAARRLSWLLIGLAVMFLLAAATAWYAWINQQKAVQAENGAKEQAIFAQEKSNEAEKARAEAERQTQIARARQLAAQAQTVMEDAPQRSVLLALEAMRTTEPDPPIPDAAEALQYVLANVGGMPLGEQASNDELVFANTGSGGTGNTGALGEQASNDELVFSSDGRWLLAWNPERARLWDITSLDLKEISIPLTNAASPIKKLVIHPDGPRLIGGSQDGTIYVWEVSNTANNHNTPYLWQKHTAAITAMVMSSDGHWLVTGSDDRNVRLWDLRDANPGSSSRILTEYTRVINDLRLSPDGRWLVIRSEQTAELWDVHNKALSIVLPEWEGKVPPIVFSADSRWLAAFDQKNMVVRMWRLTADEPKESSSLVVASTELINDLVITPDSQWLATISKDSARLWDFQNSESTAGGIPLTRYSGKFTLATDASPDGHWLLTRTIRGGSEDCTPLLWDLTAANPTLTPLSVRGHERQIMKTVFSPDHKWLLTIDVARAMRLWDLRIPRFDQGIEKMVTNHPVDSVEKQWLGILDGAGSIHLGKLSVASKLQDIAPLPYEEAITDIGLQADGNWLATLSKTGRVCLWDLRDATAFAPCIPVESSGITAIALSPDGRLLATGVEEKNLIHVWELERMDAQNRSIPLELSGVEGGIYQIVISPDNRWLVNSDNFTLQLWDLQAGSASGPVTLTGYAGSIEALAISPDSLWLAAGGRDTNIYVWKLPEIDPEQIEVTSPRPLKGQTGTIRDISFSPDNHWLATGSDDQTVWLWEIENPDAKPKILRGHSGAIARVTFSADSHWLVTNGRADKTVRVWDVKAVNPAATGMALRGQTDFVVGTVFTADHQRLLTGSSDGVIRVWQLDLEQLRARACQIAGRNLSGEEWVQHFPETLWEDYQARNGTCPEFSEKNGQ
ncbi:WD-40 repeat protein [Candidatus Vecturithrix granuli]|uniref:WD-40 repeat protein n=1 Tax=Vecturithrix granuli TaxID=1499967 RepID=A0A081C891_VECG1|nr:WD-40 repeat protein [Candidatus Vecturithrix granuli]